MGEDKKANKKRKRIVARQPVQMIVSREYVVRKSAIVIRMPAISRPGLIFLFTFDIVRISCSNPLMER